MDVSLHITLYGLVKAHLLIAPRDLLDGLSNLSITLGLSSSQCHYLALVFGLLVLQDLERVFTTELIVVIDQELQSFLESH
jgi:hypothetical protein